MIHLMNGKFMLVNTSYLTVEVLPTIS